MLYYILLGLCQAFDDLVVISGPELLWSYFESEISSISSLCELDEEALKRHISFPGKELFFIAGLIGDIDIVDAVSKQRECPDEVGSALGIDIRYMQRCFPGDFLDERESRVPVLGYQEEESFRLYVDDSDIQVFVAFLYERKVFGKPLSVFVETVWRIEVDGLGFENLGHLYDTVDDLRGDTALIGCDTHHGHMELFEELCYIGSIFRIEIQRIKVETDTIVASISGEREYLMKTIST